MKIAHIQHPFIPEMGYQENKLLKYQKKLGHTPICFTSSIEPQDRDVRGHSFTPGEYQYEGCKVVRLPTRFYINSTNSVILSGILDELNKFSPDVIHLHGSLSFSLPQCGIYSKISGVPLIVDDHLDDDNFSLENAKNNILFTLYKYTVFEPWKDTVRHFLPIHEYSKKVLREHLYVPNDKMTILPLGVDKDEFYPSEEEFKQIRNDMGITDDEFVIVTSGYLNEKKGILTIVEAISNLIDQGNNVRLVLIGPIPDAYSQKIKTKSKNRGINEDIIFTGFADRNEMRRWYNGADLGIWPGIGVSINEAIGTGLPVVLGKNLSTKHLVRYNNGVRFKKSDPGELTSVLEDLINDNDEIKRMEKSAIEFVDNELSWESIARKSIDIYKSNMN